MSLRKTGRTKSGKRMSKQTQGQSPCGATDMSEKVFQESERPPYCGVRVAIQNIKKRGVEKAPLCILFYILITCKEIDY